jgi:hypothetical protein
MPVPAGAAGGDLLAHSRPRAGRRREAVADSEVVPRGVCTAADDEPRREGREGD